jgi:hypothetical protein
MKRVVDDVLLPSGRRDPQSTARNILMDITVIHEGYFVSLCARTATLPCVPMHSIRIVGTEAYA